ncbi:tetratricopeptide repeat protein [Streptomyces nanhaiensis]|uniref:tetratricopeptide repeat protein n=1 Tax=Streptomyces nanhaiensis TaxID=679319 RepID=UPI00399CAAE1
MIEWDRRVQVRRYRPGMFRPGEEAPGDGTTRFGSGYLVAPRLVLTAAHVLGDASGPAPGTVTVCRPDAGSRQFTARVRWYRCTDTVDAALVEVGNVPDWEAPGSLADLRSQPPQRWGHLIGTRRYPATMVGFPQQQRTAGGTRLDGQVDGDILPGTGSLAQRYEILSRDPTLSGPLAGMSGAALLCGQGGDLVCGVVRVDRQATGGSWLVATPAAELLKCDDFRAVITEHSLGWDPLLEPAEPAELLEPAAREGDLRSPAMLLRADAEVVTFHGRERELRELRDWCEHDPQTFSVRVVTGPAGQGKTRLARRLTDELRGQGWVTGHLRTSLRDRDVPADKLSSLDTALPLLLVIDYADSRPNLVRRVVEHLRTTRHPTRVLLLARADGSWRQDGLGAAYAEEILARAPVTALAPLAPATESQEARAALYTGAVTDFARLLDRLPDFPGRPKAGWGVLARALRPPRDLADEEYACALTLLTRALTALLQHGTAHVTRSPDDSAAVLLRHEQRYWMRSARDHAGRLDGVPPDSLNETLHTAVAVATLCGAADQAEAVATLRGVLGLPVRTVEGVAAWLRSLYPPEQDRYWGALRPDRVGEHHVCRVLFDPALSLPVAPLFADGSTDQQIQLFTVLVRAATAHHEAGRVEQARHIEQELLRSIDRAELDHGTLVYLSVLLPHRESCLEMLALRVAQERVTLGKRRVRIEDSPAAVTSHALSLDSLSRQLTRAQRHEEALQHQENAVGILRDVVQADSGHRLLYVHVLVNLSDCLRRVGRDGEALPAVEEAVDLLCRLAHETDAEPREQSSVAFRLTNLEPQFWEAGRPDKALRVLTQAVDLYERVAEPGSGDEVLLTESLIKLGVRLVQAGHRQEALHVTEKGVERMRRLARTDLRWEPSLLSALNNQSNLLEGVGRVVEAIGVLEQAVAIGRHRIRTGLADESLEHLLRSTRLGWLQMETGRSQDAVENLRSAVGVWQRLTGVPPQVYAYIAKCLLHLGMLLFGAEQYEEAVQVTEESVQIRRHLAAADAEAGESELVDALAVLASLRCMTGDPPGALVAADEAVRICRALGGTTTSVLTSLHGVLEAEAHMSDRLGDEQRARQIRRWLAANPLLRTGSG